MLFRSRRIKEAVGPRSEPTPATLPLRGLGASWQPGALAGSPGTPRSWPRRLKHAVEETEVEVAAPHRVSDARQRSDGVEKYSSIASRQAPEHGSTSSSPLPDSRISAANLLGAVDADPGAEHPAARAVDSTCEMSVQGSPSLRLD